MFVVIEYSISFSLIIINIVCVCVLPNSITHDYSTFNLFNFLTTPRTCVSFHLGPRWNETHNPASNLNGYFHLQYELDLAKINFNRSFGQNCTSYVFLVLDMSNIC